MSYSIEEIAVIVNGQFKGPHPKTDISNLSVDSRHVAFPENTVFIALEGSRKDGHDFIKELIRKGVQNFIVSKAAFVEIADKVNIILVKDCLQALQFLAAFHRSKFTYPVIGITGSNGKTIVKEWLYQLLYNHFNIVKNPKSFNSQLGVPLSVWQMDSHHELGIFEAGISEPNEMEKLQQIIKPDIGIFTYLGEAHSAGFKSLKEKLLEKLQLFKESKTLIYSSDQELVEATISQEFKGEKLGWSFENKGTVHLTRKTTGFSTDLSGKLKEEEFHFNVPFIDDAAITNLSHCIVTSLSMGIKAEELTHMLKQISPLGMRLQIKEGVNDCMIVDDSYNADFDSLSIALQFLMQQGQKPIRTIILSDMLQSGARPQDLYKRIAGLLKSFQINKVITIGEESDLLKSLLPVEVLYRHFKTTKSFLQHYHSSDFQHEAILVKGARQFTLESIVQALSKRSHRTILEVNLTALLHNLNVYAGYLNPGVKMMVMVKASAYGAGSDEIAKLLQYHNVDYLCVAYPDEGVDLRKSGIKLPIMVLNPDEDSIATMIANNLEPEVYSLSILKAIITQSPPGSTVIGVHIKLDTGMNRLGFTDSDKDELIQLILANRQINIKSIFTHLSASENPEHDEFTHEQLNRFKRFAGDILAVIDYKPLLHVLNSSGISRFKEYQLDMVRLGIGLYGYDASANVNKQLRTVHTLKALISQIKQVSAKETVGYGRRGKLTENKKIATISIGYADGFQRKLGNGNYAVMIKGRMANTIGNVCMDMTMIDVNHIPDVNEGDEVIIFGEQIPVTNMAERLETIPYEVFTGISSRVKRVYFQE